MTPRRVIYALAAIFVGAGLGIVFLATSPHGFGWPGGGSGSSDGADGAGGVDAVTSADAITSADAVTSADASDGAESPSATASLNGAITAPNLSGDADPDASASGGDVPRVSVSANPEPAAPSTGASSSSGGVSATVKQEEQTYAGALFSLANGARADAGLSALSWNGCAAGEAVGRAARALPKSSLEHEPITFACASALSGENLARTSRGASGMHDLWMGSSGHRANILSPDFAQLGVGCTAYSKSDPAARAKDAGDIGGMLCSQMFYG